MKENALYHRYLRPRIAEALTDSPVVLIHGPRQCGKTTMARLVADDEGFAYFSFDDDLQRAAAQADPVGGEELPPWHCNRLKRLVKTHKLHLVDTGLVCTLLGLDAQRLWHAVTGEDFKGLRKLQNAAQKTFAAGVVLYDGEAVVGFGDNLYAVPISCLWEAH